MLAGRDLYSDLWDNKPPGIFIVYALFDALFGYGIHTIFIINVFFGLASLFGIYFLGSQVSSKLGFWSALFWTLISGYFWIEANQPNSEVVINSLLIWGFVLTFKRHWIFSGICFALASTVKLTAAVPVFLLSGCMGVLFFMSRPRNKSAVLDLLKLCLPGVTAWAILAVYFLLNGQFGDFYDTVFVYAKFYSAGIKNNLTASFGQLFHPKFLIALPCFILVGLGLAISCFRKKIKPIEVLLIVWMVSAFLMVGLPGKFFAHYYQYWLPVFSLGIGLLVVQFSNKKTELLIGGAIGIGLIIFQIPDYRLSSDEISIKKYEKDFINIRDYSKLLSPLLATSSSKTFYVWGIDPGFYFYTKTSPPTGVNWCLSVIEGPLKERLWNRTISMDLPAYVIIDRGFYACVDSKAEVPLTWIRSHYEKSKPLLLKTVTEAPSAKEPLKTELRFELWQLRGNKRTSQLRDFMGGLGGVG